MRVLSAVLAAALVFGPVAAVSAAPALEGQESAITLIAEKKADEKKADAKKADVKKADKKVTKKAKKKVSKKKKAARKSCGVGKYYKKGKCVSAADKK